MPREGSGHSRRRYERRPQGPIGDARARQRVCYPPPQRSERPQSRGKLDWPFGQTTSAAGGVDRQRRVESRMAAFPMRHFERRQANFCPASVICNARRENVERRLLTRVAVRHVVRERRFSSKFRRLASGAAWAFVSDPKHEWMAEVRELRRGCERPEVGLAGSRRAGRVRPVVAVRMLIGLAW